jgi:hypothetical protein
MLHVGREANEAEQRAASAHERRRHELHSTTSWGLAMTVVSLRDDGPNLLERWLSDACVTVHETFATWPVRLLGDVEDDAVGRLFGEGRYAEYLAQGDVLASAAGSASTAALLVDATLRALMAPLGLLELDGEALLRLRLSEMRDADRPDSRFRRLRKQIEGGGLASLAALTLVEDDDPAYRGFRDRVAEVLTAHGLATMTTQQQHDWTTEVVATVNRRVAATLEIVDTPQDPVFAAYDDFQRERLGLHDAPLPLPPAADCCRPVRR